MVGFLIAGHKLYHIAGNIDERTFKLDSLQVGCVIIKMK